MPAGFHAAGNGAGPDRTRLTVFEQIIGEAAFTMYIFQTHPVDLGQPLLEFDVIIPVGNINGADTTVQAAWGGQVLFIFHFRLPGILYVHQYNARPDDITRIPAGRSPLTDYFTHGSRTGAGLVKAGMTKCVKLISSCILLVELGIMTNVQFNSDPLRSCWNEAAVVCCAMSLLAAIDGEQRS
jgi:hypothetical protein